MSTRHDPVDLTQYGTRIEVTVTVTGPDGERRTLTVHEVHARPTMGEGVVYSIETVEPDRLSMTSRRMPGLDEHIIDLHVRGRMMRSGPDGEMFRVVEEGRAE